MATASKTAVQQPAPEALETSALSSLLQKEFKPKTDEAREAVESAVRTLAEQALATTAKIAPDAYRTIQAIIAEIDRKLSEQINLIIHHPEFQQVEGAWRGLHYLVNNTETDEMLKIRVLNISENELGRTLTDSCRGDSGREVRRAVRDGLAGFDELPARVLV